MLKYNLIHQMLGLPRLLWVQLFCSCFISYKCIHKWNTLMPLTTQGCPNMVYWRCLIDWLKCSQNKYSKKVKLFLNHYLIVKSFSIFFIIKKLIRYYATNTRVSWLNWIGLIYQRFAAVYIGPKSTVLRKNATAKTAAGKTGQ